MAWPRRVNRHRPVETHRPDTQTVIARLDSLLDRMDGSLRRIEELAPLIQAYADSLAAIQRRGGRDA